MSSLSLDTNIKARRQLKRPGRPLCLKISSPLSDSQATPPLYHKKSPTADEDADMQISPQSREKGPALHPLNTSSTFIHRPVVTPSSAHPLSAGSEISMLSAGPYQNEPILILPHLYLGSEKNASSKEVIIKKNIGGIINVGQECRNHFDGSLTFSAIPQSPSFSNTDTEDYFEIAPLSPVYNPLNLNGRAPLSGRRKSKTGRLKRRHTLESLFHPTSSSRDSVRGKRSPKQKSPREKSPVSTLVDKFNKQLHSSSTSSLETCESTDSSSVDITLFVAPKYLKYPWTHNEDLIARSFQEAFDFIDEMRSQEKGVLIHCKQGISRSATLVIAYVMKTMQISMNEAYAFVKRRSPHVSPNLSFIFQLLDYEKQLGLGTGQTPDLSEVINGSLEAVQE